MQSNGCVAQALRAPPSPVPTVVISTSSSPSSSTMLCCSRSSSSTTSSRLRRGVDERLDALEARPRPSVRGRLGQERERAAREAVLALLVDAR